MQSPGRNAFSRYCALAIFWVFITSGITSAADIRAPNIIVIFADDLGYADVAAQGRAADVRTPHLDRLAQEGVRCTAGYCTAPQCTPSRAGLLTGRHQQRFGIDTIPDGPLPLAEVTIAERLKPAGYVSGSVGKWHLEPNVQCRRWITEHLGKVPADANRRVPIPVERVLEYFPHKQGFDEFFSGAQRRYYANFDVAGQNLAAGGEWVNDDRFRVHVQSDAAVAFVKRNASRPFFLYLTYYTPHVPLEASPEDLARIPGKMAERRRLGLSMIAAMDDGVGRILKELKEQKIDEQTLIIFSSDNGAPLKLIKEDLPLSAPAASWNGSQNDPWIGEKGMLSEGGIRVPFLLRWPGMLPAGKVYNEPVSTLDIAATAVSLAGQPRDAQLDGVDLVPYLTGRTEGSPHESLYWRFWNQAAIRSGKWKYLRAGNQAEFLFDLESEAHESKNLIAESPDVTAKLRDKLSNWTDELQPPGLPKGNLNGQEQGWYHHYFNLPLTPSGQ